MISQIVSFSLLIIIYPLVLYLFYITSDISNKVSIIEKNLTYISKIINQNNNVLETKINT
jgi:hypothetical protein